MDQQKLYDLLKHFSDHGISQDPKNGLDKVVAFQDVIGRATLKEWAEEYAKMNESFKDLFFFAVTNCLDRQTTVHLIKECALRDALNSAICHKEKAWREAHDYQEATISNMTNQILDLQREAESLRTEVDRLRDDEVVLRSERDSLREEIEDLRQDRENLETLKKAFTILGLDKPMRALRV